MGSRIRNWPFVSRTTPDSRSWYCAEAVAWHLHDQSLEDVLAKRIDTARPLLRLLAKHPQRAHELSADVLLPPSPGDPPGLRARKLLVAAATNRLFYSLVRSLAGAVWLRGLSRDAMVYLIACQYRRGLRLVSGEDNAPSGP